MENAKKEKAVKRLYSSKMKKYKLPSLEEIQKELKISVLNLEPDKNLILISLRGEISNILRTITRDIEMIVSGSDTYCCNIERREFTKEDRISLFETYAKMQQLYWEGRIAFLEEEEDVAKWINKFFKLWKTEFKKKFIWYTKKMHKSWVDIKNRETELKYVG